MDKNVNWRDVKGYEGLFIVSDQGQVLKLPRIDALGKVYGFKSMKGGINADGYVRVGLQKDGKERKVFLHRIVMESFSDEIPEGCEVNHKNLNKQDNRLENLEWTSHCENMNHAKKNGVLDNRRTRAKTIYNHNTGETYKGYREVSAAMNMSLWKVGDAIKKGRSLNGMFCEVIKDK